MAGKGCPFSFPEEDLEVKDKSEADQADICSVM
jgi:hypothetical protein